MIPNNGKLYIKEQKREFLYPLNKVYDPLISIEKGGVDINNPALGLTYQNWNLTYENKSFILRSADGKQYNLKTLENNIELTKVSFAFDQNMQIVWGYTHKLPLTQSYETYFYWYDTSINDYAEIFLDYCKDITISLDDKRSNSNSFNDILLSYITVDNWLTVRLQRDRYLKPLRLKRLPENTVITDIGMTRDYRFQYEIRAVTPAKHKNDIFQLETI